MNFVLFSYFVNFNYSVSINTLSSGKMFFFSLNERPQVELAESSN